MLDPEDHLDLDAVVAVVNEYGAATRDAAGESADPFPAEPPITGLPIVMTVDTASGSSRAASRAT